MNSTPVKIDIWSDVMCPFCYIGKRKLEGALKMFPASKDVQIEWHSYQLDPDMQGEEGKNIYEYLAEKKGQTMEWSVKMHENVVKMAAEAGLEYHFERSVVANSFTAHRLLQFSKTLGLANEMEEQLFKAYFTDGKDISNHEVLADIAVQAGIPRDEALNILNSDAYTKEVTNDIDEAMNIGVNGVPFFVFNNKYAISGAQPEEYFLQVLNQCASEGNI